MTEALTHVLDTPYKKEVVNPADVLRHHKEWLDQVGPTLRNSPAYARQHELLTSLDGRKPVIILSGPYVKEGSKDPLYAMEFNKEALVAAYDLEKAKVFVLIVSPDDIVRLSQEVSRKTETYLQNKEKLRDVDRYLYEGYDIA